MSVQSLPPQKKRRLSSGDGNNEITRSQYWFEDGNVVLQTENTLFRVHRSILSRRSKIFEDTFAIPQAPSEGNELIEGCPVIQLSDTTKDMNNMISLLYDPDKILGFGRILPSSVVGSMLRLGRKYVIPSFENEALRRLHHDFPTTLGEWDSTEDCQIKDGDSDSEDDLSTVLGVIPIAHEFRLFTILPAAYAKYLGIQFLVALFCHKGAVVSDHFFEQEKIPEDTCLPEKARECCLIGYARILQFLKEAYTNALFPSLKLPSEKKCSGSGKCKAVQRRAIQKLPLWRTEESSTFGVFSCWGETDPSVTEGLCSQCKAEVEKLANNVRSEFWSNLPSFFGMADWADLKDEL